MSLSSGIQPTSVNLCFHAPPNNMPACLNIDVVDMFKTSGVVQE
ncbi:hypothetical protein TGAM01_v205000 [Trichoderma gamsii]|uniref:Uncharacterized protein n=1 Tax=Trichoderma gamsii TaxID=398673 RepID=A0A2P4ZP62_9HYPO|nr:hypothetical protein TGAM01_v205000 [Trichoderma gamsii]PON26056.1 hypothetical protein TGAM01_v205000 [Trichoderma gamsii]